MGDEENRKPRSLTDSHARHYRPLTLGDKQNSDLRSQALMCHKDIQTVWGKKASSDEIQHLRNAEVEAFALDRALRKFWNIQKSVDETVACFISSEISIQLRKIVLEILEKHLTEVTRVYSFEIPDPIIIKQREEEKQQQLSATRSQRKERAEAAKKAKEERLKKMKAKRNAKEATNGTDESKILETKPESEIKPESEVKPESETKPESEIKPESETNSESLSKAKLSTTTSVETPTESLLTATQQSKTNDSPKSTLSGKISPSLQERRAFFCGKIEKKTFVRPDLSKNTKSGTSEPQISKRANSNSVADRAAAAKRAFAQSKNTAGFTKPGATKPVVLPGEEPIPNIVIKRELIDAIELSKLIENRVSEEFSTETIPILKSETEFLDFYHLSVKGPRPSNEDEYVVVEHVNELHGLPPDTEKYSFFGAYDGHSGKYTSLYVRSQLHHAVFKHPDFPTNIEKAIHDSFLEIDRLVNEIQERDQFSCGTTALSVWFRDNEELIIGNVGDCRGFLCRDGKPFEVSEPHFPNRDDEKARIKSNGGAVVWHGTWRVNGILAVSRSIGDYNLRKIVIADPDVTRIKLQPADEFLLLASDGLWDVLSPEEAFEIIQTTSTTQGRKFVCKTLCDTALEKNTKDNVTVVVTFFNHAAVDEQE